MEVRSSSGANCSREDSNLHGLPHTVLSRTRLPIPPRELEKFGRLNCAAISRAQAEIKVRSSPEFIRAAFFERALRAAAPCGLCLTTEANRHNLRQRFRNLPAACRSLLPNS